MHTRSEHVRAACVRMKVPLRARVRRAAPLHAAPRLCVRVGAPVRANASARGRLRRGRVCFPSPLGGPAGRPVAITGRQGGRANARGRPACRGAGTNCGFGSGPQLPPLPTRGFDRTVTLVCFDRTDVVFYRSFDRTDGQNRPRPCRPGFESGRGRLYAVMRSRRLSPGRPIVMGLSLSHPPLRYVGRG